MNRLHRSRKFFILRQQFAIMLNGAQRHASSTDKLFTRSVELVQGIDGLGRVNKPGVNSVLESRF
jgi:hypothetical protein